MIDVNNLKKAWALLSPRERRNAKIVLAVAAVAALSAALMVGSVLPFLTVLAEPKSIHSVPQLDWAYRTFGFTSDYSFLVALGLVTLTVIVVSNLLQVLRLYATTRYGQIRIFTLSRKLLGAYLSQPYEFFLNRHSGDMSTRVLAEVEQVVNNFFMPILDLVAASLTILALIVLLVWVDPVVAISVFVVFGGSYGLVYTAVRARIRRLGKERLKSNQERFLAAKEVLSGIKEVKLHGNEEVYLRRFGDASYRTMNTQVKANLIGQLPQYFMQSLALGGMVVLVVLLLDPSDFGGGEGASLATLLPTLGVIAFAGQRMMPELSRVYSALTRLKFGTAALDSVFADLHGGQSAAGIDGPRPAPLGLREELRLDDVTYRYPNAAKDSLLRTSLTIRAGERIGLVGGTGAGKTTVADLLLGLLAPSSGRILVDGTAIDDTTRRSWQQSVAYVPQEIFLIDASLYENIAFGVKAGQIDRARVEDSARLAQLDAFVRRDLPQGYETRIGERGVRLSGGQRQRIGIARALYHNADLIVFDEATSALDNLTEREVMAAIDATPGDKTMLIIAHRLSTVRSCDRIIMLDQGQIVDSGSWEELMEQSAAFRKLAAAA
jgi:ATP-binding cassette, subfamily B, bacterial PglK